MVAQIKYKTRLYQDQFDTILDIAQTINKEHGVESLLVELGLDKMLVYTCHNNEWTNLLNIGVADIQLANINVERDLCVYNNTEHITSSHPKQLKEFEFVIPLFRKNKRIGYVLIGKVYGEDEKFNISNKYQKLIQIISNLIIVFIENKKMQDALLKQEVIKKEMELASRIQKQLVPKNNALSGNPKFKTNTYYRPQNEVGGDYYDFIQLSDNTIGFCIADVSGKGIAAALLMSNFQATFRALFTSHISLKKLIKNLNCKVNESANSEKFITLFLGKYNTLTRRLSYINAGHVPPLIFDTHKKRLKSLHKGCIGLGMLDEIPSINMGRIRINKDSKFVAFTDGLVELENGDEVESGLKYIEDILSNKDSFEENMDDIKELINRHIKEGVVFDDITMMGIGFS